MILAHTDHTRIVLSIWSLTPPASSELNFRLAACVSRLEFRAHTCSHSPYMSPIIHAQEVATLAFTSARAAFADNLACVVDHHGVHAMHPCQGSGQHNESDVSCICELS